MFKPARMQYSCTCLQYDIDFDKVPAVLAMAKKLGFLVKKTKPPKEAVIQKEHYVLSRAVEAKLEECGEDWILEYSDEKDNYHVPDDFQRALDCLRLSFISGELTEGCGCFFFGEPAPAMNTDPDFSQQVQEQQKRFSVYLQKTPWLFASITNKCNLDCRFCYSKKGEEEISIASFEKAVEQWKQNDIRHESISGLGITLGGGEPTLHPELEKIVEAARKKVHLVTLTTNGTNNKRLIALADQLDGVCISAPFIYTNELNVYCGQSNEKIKEHASELAQKFKKLCLATVITSKMQPEDVFKADEIATELGATNTLFLLYKPVLHNLRDAGLMPTKKQARKILESILELAFKKHNTAIDCCLSSYAVRPGCGFHYVKTDGVLKTTGWRGECSFDSRYDCLVKYIDI